VLGQLDDWVRQTEIRKKIQTVASPSAYATPSLPKIVSYPNHLSKLSKLRKQHFRSPSLIN